SATPVKTSAYDTTGNLVVSTDELGRTTWRQYDALGRLTAETSPLGRSSGDPQATSRTEYDSAGRVTATIDSLGRRTDTVYDSLGRTIRTLAPDAGLGRPTTHSGYDAAGNLRFTTDPRGTTAGDTGFTTYFFYDSLGRKTASVDALGPDWTVTALPDSLSGTVTTNVTRTVYDAGAGPLARPVTRFTYDAVGNQTSVIDPLGNTTTSAYDALDRRTTVTDARGFATVTTYDSLGNTTSVTDASGNVTRYAYDRRNRPVTETDPLLAVTSYAYDAVGNKTKETDRLGRVSTFVYDAADRLVEERWQASATAAVLHTISWVYDAADQLLGVTETDTVNPAATTAWQFSYDAGGNVVKSRMAPGEILQQPAFGATPNPPGALAAGDPTLDWDGDGSAERYDPYTITLAIGDQLLLTAASAAFDPVLILQRPTGGLTTAFFDDNSGGGTAARLLVTADTAGTWTIAVTARDHTATGSYNLQIVKDQNAIVPTALVQYDFTYDKAGNRTATRENQAAVADMYGFGPAATGLGIQTSATVDALNRVTRYRHIDIPSGQVQKRADYAYRADGSVSSVTRYVGAGTYLVGSSPPLAGSASRLPSSSHPAQLLRFRRRREGTRRAARATGGRPCGHELGYPSVHGLRQAAEVLERGLPFLVVIQPGLVCRHVGGPLRADRVERLEFGLNDPPGLGAEPCVEQRLHSAGEILERRTVIPQHECDVVRILGFLPLVQREGLDENEGFRPDDANPDRVLRPIRHRAVDLDGIAALEREIHATESVDGQFIHQECGALPASSVLPCHDIDLDLLARPRHGAIEPSRAMFEPVLGLLEPGPH
ncbi:MAG: hypothetical protein K8S94_14905, partial [Planctomycetia bacterium]|nr:hypothetical protein [Planctomycetia bacterium]